MSKEVAEDCDSSSEDYFDFDWDGEAESSSPPALRSLDAPGPSTLMHQDCINKSEDIDDIDWDADGEADSSPAPALRSLDAPGPSTLVQPDADGRADVVREFVRMGFPKEMVLKGIKDIGDSDTDSLLELLLTYQAIAGDPSLNNCSTSGHVPQCSATDDDDDIDLENWDDGNGDSNSDGSDAENFLQEMAQKDKKIQTLVDMGFPHDEAQMAVDRCGSDAPVFILADSIYASQYARNDYSRNLSDHENAEMYGFHLFGERKKPKKRKRYGAGAHENQACEDPMPLPNPMIGFGLPGHSVRPSVSRRIPEQAIGPPFFYYENVALAPKGVWAKISRHLYEIEPEFVDSKYICAAARKRGYIHNLPLENRSHLIPLPPKTIFEAFPHYKKWWPSWDQRTQLNCLQTVAASAKLTEEIRRALAKFGDAPPSESTRRYIIEQCRKWNLVWVGKNRAAPLEHHEMELLLGFPRDHTRGACKTDRYKSLGNSFQIDTVAYHLSVLKNLYPNGMNVLSLFTGIGGGEVALHKLGIHMKTVVSVEISQVNRNILRGWWEQTRQKGVLIEIADIKSLNTERMESLIKEYGGFDLVIGGSPCNNLAGSNRLHRDGLEGHQSSLFFDYKRILEIVKSIMGRM